MPTDEQQTSREGKVTKIQELVNRYVWSILGAIIAVFIVFSLREVKMLDILGMLCLASSVVCLVIVQANHLKTTASPQETTLAPIAIILAFIGLILIWPTQAKAVVLHLLEGLAAFHG